MFLGWQIFVCVSIIAAGSVSKKAMNVVALCWVGWTVFAVLPVFAFWVGIFQLANVGVTYSVMNSKK